jgi:hypothetical protein
MWNFGHRIGRICALAAVLSLAPLANAQFKTIAPPPYSTAVARQKIKSLLTNLTPDNIKPTTEQLTRLLTWYRDLFDQELIAAWQTGTNRPSLRDVIEPFADTPTAASIVAISWRDQRAATFTPEYAPMLAGLMGRFADSAKPVIDDLQGNLATLISAISKRPRSRYSRNIGASPKSYSRKICKASTRKAA